MDDDGENLVRIKVYNDNNNNNSNEVIMISIG
jgi:hypothetical protein